jgi:hypothetical protein
MRLADGATVKFGIPPQLQRLIAGVPVGAAVRLTYLRLEATKDGAKSFHAFDFGVDLSSLPEATKDKADDSGIPF